MNQSFFSKPFALNLLLLLAFSYADAQILTRELEFVSERFDFGEVNSGSKKIETSFVFTNKGENDFTISNWIDIYYGKAMLSLQIVISQFLVSPIQHSNLICIFW